MWRTGYYEDGALHDKIYGKKTIFDIKVRIPDNSKFAYEDALVVFENHLAMLPRFTVYVPIAFIYSGHVVVFCPR